MRRDAGRILTGQIWIGAAMALSLVTGAYFKPWGYLAGPGLLLFGVGVALVSGLLSDHRSRAGVAALLEIAKNPGATPAYGTLMRWVESVDRAEAHAPTFLRAASDRAHPAREAFCLLCSRMNPKDPELPRVLAEFVIDHPEAPHAWDFAREIIRAAPSALAERVARAALSSGAEKTARYAARQLVFRASEEESFLALVRELKADVGPRLDEVDVRERFAKLTA